MEHSYHDQAPTKTLTVADLIERLRSLDPASPVIFRSPHFGIFGSNQTYPVSRIEALTMERREHHNPARTYIDEETGDELHDEEHMQVWPEWTGVVISCADAL